MKKIILFSLLIFGLFGLAGVPDKEPVKTGCWTTKVQAQTMVFRKESETTPAGSDTYIQFNDAGSFGGNLGFVFKKASGNVGIGTTLPTQKLEVVGSLKLGAYVLPSTDGSDGQVLKTDGSGTLTWQADTGGGTGSPGGNDTYVQFNDNGTFGGSLEFVFANNNVGIGITLPTVKLDVVGNFKVSGTSTTDSLTVSTGLSLPANSVTNAMVSDTLTASDLVAGSSVVADAEVDNNITITSTANMGTLGNLGAGVTAPAYRLQVGTTPLAALMVVLDSGNVGIGTTLPTQKLEVVGSLKLGAYVLPSTDGSDGQVLKTDGSGTLTWEAAGGAGAIAFDDIGDPDAATTIAFDNDEVVSLSSAEDTGAFLTLLSTDADLAGDTVLLTLSFQQATDVNQYFLQCKDNLADVPVIVFKIGTDGNTTIAGTLGVTGQITGNVTGNLTGNADTVTTNANLTGEVTSVGNATTIADSVAVTSWNLTTPTITTSLTTSTPTTLTAAELDRLDGLTSAIIDDDKIDTFAELDAIVADKALVNKADGAVWLGVHDFGGATSTEIVNSASPTVDAAGEIAVDTSDDQLIYYGGAKRVVTYKQQKCFALENPVAADDNVPIFFPTDAITVTNMSCMCKGGTSAEVILSDGTNALDTMTCDVDGAVDDGNIANAAFTANEEMQFDIGTVTGSVTWVTLCFTYTTTAE